MKTYGNLYEQIYQFDSLYRGYLKARLGKRHQPEVMRFERDLEGNLIQLQNELIWGEYRTSEYHRFHIHEPKTRLVAALPFRDRVVQHSIISVLEPIFEPRMIHHSFACRPGKGIHAGADQAQQWIRVVQRRHGRVYALKADVRKYFPSINHQTLEQILARRIRCARTLQLCRDIIASYGPGLPIGNLTSQLWANVYLDRLDQHVKHHLRERYYARYMDDFIIIGHDKQHLHQLRRHLDGWLLTHLQLRLNDKTQVFPIGPHALDFLGYRIWPTHRKVRRKTLRRMRRTLKRLRASYAAGHIGLARIREHITSWLGHVRNASSYHSRRRVLASVSFRRAT